MIYTTRERARKQLRRILERLSIHHRCGQIITDIKRNSNGTYVLGCGCASQVKWVFSECSLEASIHLQRAFPPKYIWNTFAKGFSVWRHLQRAVLLRFIVASVCCLSFVICSKLHRSCCSDFEQLLWLNRRPCGMSENFKPVCLQTSSGISAELKKKTKK